MPALRNMVAAAALVRAELAAGQLEVPLVPAGATLAPADAAGTPAKAGADPEGVPVAANASTACTCCL